MRQPLTTDVVMSELNRLHAAFPRNLGKQDPLMMASVYKEGLRGVETDALRGAVDISIQSDQFFPKVARLRELAHEWMKRNRASFAPALVASWDTCGICGAKALPRMITRPKKDGAKGELETVESRSLYMDHDPKMHNVREEAEGVA